MDVLATLQAWVRTALVARGASSRVVSILSYPVHYYEVPPGPNVPAGAPPLLLVHGLGGSAISFSRVLHRLAKHFQGVWALDFPGSGFSPAPEAGPLSLEQHLAVLHGFLKEVVKARPLVVGNSLGGALSLMLASRYPGDVRGLALVSPAGARVSEERLLELLSAFEVRTAADARALTRRLLHRPSLPALLFAPLLMTTFDTPSVRALRSEAKALRALQPEVLRGLQVPVMLLWGASEKLLPSEGIEYFREHLPAHAQVEVVEGFGHVPQMERPAEVVQRLAAFGRKLHL